VSAAPVPGGTGEIPDLEWLYPGSEIQSVRELSRSLYQRAPIRCFEVRHRPLFPVAWDGEKVSLAIARRLTTRWKVLDVARPLDIEAIRDACDLALESIGEVAEARRERPAARRGRK
jgi:hypothetical protein